MRTLVVGTALAVALAAAGAALAADVATVQIRNFEFSGQQVRVAVGGSVMWTNLGPSSHTVTADGGAFDSGVLAPTGTFTFTFTREGVYDYHCAIHSTMKGQVLVGNVQAPEKPNDNEPPGYGPGY